MIKVNNLNRFLKSLLFLDRLTKSKSNRSELNYAFWRKFHLYHYLILNSNTPNSFPGLKFINNTSEYTICECDICNILYLNVIYKSKISHGRNFSSLVFNSRGEYLRDHFDFSWTLHANIKLDYFQKIEVIFII